MKKIIFPLFTALIIFSANVYGQDFIKLTGSVVSTDSGASRSVNWIDYDNDNDLDLFISNGLSTGQDNYLYRNDNGTFVKILNQPVVLICPLTAAAGVIMIMTDCRIFAL